MTEFLYPKLKKSNNSRVYRKGDRPKIFCDLGVAGAWSWSKITEKFYFTKCYFRKFPKIYKVGDLYFLNIDYIYQKATWVLLLPRTAGVANISSEVVHLLRNFYEKSYEKYLLVTIWININVYFDEYNIKFNIFWKNDRSATIWEFNMTTFWRPRKVRLFIYF